jgi:hypothetical protein
MTSSLIGFLAGYFTSMIVRHMVRSDYDERREEIFKLEQELEICRLKKLQEEFTFEKKT